MRISTGMLHNSVLNNISQSHARILKMQAQISSGRRIERPSDDPAGITRVLQTRSSQRANAQWSRNLVRSRQFVLATESTLSVIADLASEARILATRAADDSQSEDALTAYATQIDSLLEGVLSQANCRHAGLQLFGGSETEEAPFAALRNEEGKIIQVTAAPGGRPEGELVRLIGENELLVINTRPAEVFGDNLDLFEDLISLRDAVQAADRGQVQGLMERLDEDLERATIAQSVSGVLMQRIDRLEERLELRGIDLEMVRSEEEDLDVTRALIDYQEEQAMLEAALTMTSRMLELTLSRFLS